MVTTGRMVWVGWGVLAAAAVALLVALAGGRTEPVLGDPVELESPAPAVTLEPTPDGSAPGQITSPAPSPSETATAPATPTASRTTAVVPQQPVLVPDDDDDDDEDDDDDDDDD
ncbi:hypothetical protein GA707_03350 [Nostocoides sp. F2B08]|uniref:hypothetical protein n=1 Tax=Nostocoides sp. F2B08 TaxID=2653936 RepID=UPI0012633D2A|nr:hypothetical protein [Tetrasphaera sp. F2B08]KAB7746536.1 hypothetical protein GA707_03350 [Tetrasphaera sp. F2B08]